MSDSPVAIVTGGAQGLGAAICIELLKKGYRVCAVDIQGEKAEEFAKQQQLVYGKENIIAAHCDVSKESDYARVFEETIKTFKRVDALINNAGILLESNPRRTIDVNLMPLHFDKDGVVFACVAPHMIDTDILKSVNKTLVPDYDISKVHSHILMRPEFVAKGFMKVLEDRINGSTLIVIPGEYRYIEVFEETLKHFKRVDVLVNNAGIILPTDLQEYIQVNLLPFYYEKDEVLFASLCPYVDAKTMKAINKACKLELNSSSGSDKLSPEYAAKGVLKLLEDKINGSTLLVVPNGYHYYEPID
ncbi:Farnesol dehydrogenase like protein [Argiope bruennichi]|uniref:15-hydroxyprostaglandin dehydrogenase [NAD(+)] n=1 Tax=Argiope bruennichi TaxID=94029 RepID=A0A8T0EWC0_ARGBR|nr:Farnesol dehydrogenase like protein [Argiope bruennichi]